jgi:hypothetical protein
VLKALSEHRAFVWQVFSWRSTTTPFAPNIPRAKDLGCLESLTHIGLYRSHCFHTCYSTKRLHLAYASRCGIAATKLQKAFLAVLWPFRTQPVSLTSQNNHHNRTSSVFVSCIRDCESCFAMVLNVKALLSFDACFQHAAFLPLPTVHLDWTHKRIKHEGT